FADELLIAAADRPSQSEQPNEWLYRADQFATLAERTIEIGVYCNEYQAIARSSTLPDYYRRRIDAAVRFMEAAGVIGSPLAAKMEPDPIYKLSAKLLNDGN